MGKKSLHEIMTDLCPVLSVQQLYRISTMYWDDKYGTETVSGEVLAQMKQAMVQDHVNSNGANSSFLLDDDPSVPLASTISRWRAVTWTSTTLTCPCPRSSRER